ncbi:heavy-metal-associated domain-containing protein [Cytophagaceae bacterium ABcell3]|nr:heavy-metal-associated domain-containing protein [Cytophagaceae bacterium ABcell3]
MFGLFKEKGKKIKFKTNINCGGCIKKVKPFLDKVDNLKKWDVDIADNDKILTVRGDEVQEKDVIKAVEEAGFKIETVK